MSRVGTILGFAALPLMLALAFLVAYFHEEPKDGTFSTKQFKRNMGEGIVLNRSGLYGIDLVRLGSSRIEKRRMGALTLGGLNVLVLDDLSVVLPKKPESDIVSDDQSPKGVLARLGVDAASLSGDGQKLRFSDLRINRLNVSELCGTNVVPVFAAESGRACQEGLRLEGCKVVIDGREVPVSRAVLKVRPRLRLEYDDGFRDLW